MINVSFNDLMVGNELPGPRTSSRSETSAFAALLDRKTAGQDVTASDTPRDRFTELRDNGRITAAASAMDTGRTESTAVAERPSRHGAEATNGGERHSLLDIDSKGAPDATSPSPSTDTADTTNAGANAATAAANADTNDAVTDESAPADQSAAVVAKPLLPFATLPADIALLAAPGLAPQSFNLPAMSPQTAATLPPIQAAPDAVASAPKGAHVLPQPGHANPATVSDTATTAGEGPTTIPAATGKSFSETLFAATMLAQPDAADPGIVLPPGFDPQAAPATRSQTASAPAAADLSFDSASTIERPPHNVPAAPAAVQRTATQPSPARGPQLEALLELQNIDFDVTQAGPSISGKSLPALANGMVTQIGLMQTADKPAALSSTATATGSAAEIFLGIGNTATQTATAVAASPAVQPVADDLQSKTAPDQDAVVLNAPAPAGATHAGPSAAADHNSPAKFTVPTQPATDQVAVHIAKAAAEGADKINIKLKPVSLGQIEVQLDVASDGRVHAVIAADKPETLDLLQRDARGLERALNDAGLRTDSGSLSFNLRGQNQQFGWMVGNAGPGGGFGAAADRAAPDMDLLGNASRIGAYLNARAGAGGVDIQV